MTNSTNETAKVSAVPGGYPPWTTAPCENCGVDGQASRSEAKTTPYICEGCEMYDRGMADGIAQGQAEIDILGKRIVRFKEILHSKDSANFRLMTLVEAFTANAEVVDRTKALNLRLYGFSQMAKQTLAELLERKADDQQE